jgi:uncharacterized protein YhaN
MKIERIQIDAFGRFRDLRIDLGPGLNVVFGPNEAGKSTLLAFVRAMLFGFGRRNDPSRFEPPEGALGGELLLSTSAGRLTVRRTGTPRGRYQGQLLLRDGGGASLGEVRLQEALAGASRDLFEQLFAFGLEELASFDELSAEGSVSEALFAAGMSGAHRLPQAVAALEKSTDALFAKRGQAKPLPATLARLAEVRDRLRALGDRPREYLLGKDKLRSLEGALAALDEKERALGKQREHQKNLLAVSSELMQWSALRSELASLPPELGVFPEAGVSRLEELSARVAKATAERDRLERTAASILRALSEAEVAPNLREAQGRLSSTLAAFGARLELFRSLPNRRAQLEARRRHLEEGLSALGVGFPLDALRTLELGGGIKAQLASLGQEFARAEEELRVREEALRVARAQVVRVEGEIQRLSEAMQALPVRAEARVKHELAAVELIPRIQGELHQCRSAIVER